MNVERPNPKTAERLRVIAMAPGDPYDPRTISGVSTHLFTAMASDLELAGTLSSLPSEFTHNLVRLRAFAPTKSAWRSRYRLSMYQVRAARRAAEGRFRLLGDPSYDAFFQIGTYCNVARVVRKPIFALLDHDLVSMIRIDPRMKRTSLASGYVRRRIEDEKSVLDSTARVFTFSEWCRARIVENYALSPTRIESVGAGSNIDEALLAAEPDYEARHAVFIGFDFERKGGAQVLRAFAQLRSQLPAARLTLIGGMPPGMPAPNVRSIGRIVGPNSQARIAEILRSASLYVMPSLFEPFGIAFLEAMAAGLPCIGSERCAMPEIIGETGAIVPAGDSDALARELHALLSDPAACRERGRAARARYRERYGWDKVAKRITSSIERTIGKSHAP